MSSSTEIISSSIYPLPRLIFHNIPTKYPFYYEPFNIEIWLIDEENELLPESIEFTLNLKLSPGNTSRCIEPWNCNEYLNVNGITRTSSTGKCILSINILKLSQDVDGNWFILMATPLSIHIQSAISFPLYCIRYRLEIANLEEIPHIWYKDQSISSKHAILAKIRLNSPHGIVLHRTVPLQILPRYFDETTSLSTKPDLRILKIYSPQFPCINQQGTCDVYFTFTQVSSRNYHRNFSILVKPDLSKDPNAQDISPLEFGNIEVRSKPAWRRQKKHPVTSIEPPIKAPGSESTQTEVQMDSPPRKMQRRSQIKNVNPIGISPPVTVGPTNRGKAKSLPVVQSNKPNSKEESPPLLDFHPDQSLTADIFDSNNSTNQDVTTWLHSIMKLLPALRWKQIGNESVLCQSVNGQNSVFRSKPIYDMPFPNAIIDQILEAYHNFFPVASSSSSHLTGTGSSLTTPEGGSYSHLEGESISLINLLQEDSPVAMPLTYRQVKTSSSFLHGDPLLPSLTSSQILVPHTPPRLIQPSNPLSKQQNKQLFSEEKDPEAN